VGNLPPVPCPSASAGRVSTSPIAGTTRRARSARTTSIAEPPLGRAWATATQAVCGLPKALLRRLAGQPRPQPRPTAGSRTPPVPARSRDQPPPDPRPVPTITPPSSSAATPSSSRSARRVSPPRTAPPKVTRTHENPAQHDDDPPASPRRILARVLLRRLPPCPTCGRAHEPSRPACDPGSPPEKLRQWRERQRFVSAGGDDGEIQPALERGEVGAVVEARAVSQREQQTSPRGHPQDRRPGHLERPLFPSRFLALLPAELVSFNASFNAPFAEPHRLLSKILDARDRLHHLLGQLVGARGRADAPRGMAARARVPTLVDAPRASRLRFTEASGVDCLPR
jgi:hypothetical protein